MEMIVLLPKSSMMPICSGWKQSKGGRHPLPHEIDDPCLKWIMVSKSEIHHLARNSTSINRFKRELKRYLLYINKNALKFCCIVTGPLQLSDAGGGGGGVWTNARSILALPVWHCRRTLKSSLEQNYQFVWDSCLRWFMGVNNKSIVLSKSRLALIARWGNLPICMVLQSEGSLKLEMLSLARASTYVNNTSVLSINKIEEDS